VRARINRNSLRALKVNDMWVEAPVEVRREVVDFFSRHVSDVPWERLKLDGVLFPSLSEADNIGLVTPFMMEEIEKVVKESDGNKSLGPDGFNFAFDEGRGPNYV
jgi:hypothetical protein